MKLIAILLASILVFNSILAAPTTDKDDETVTIEKDFYDKSLVVYTAEHDIIKIVLPLNAINFGDDDDDSDEDENTGLTLIFVEADMSADGKKDYKGLYVFKNGQAKKLLDNGRDAAAGTGVTKTVYLAASDGLYTYNDTTSTAQKYGTLTDSIIGIAKANNSDVLYILTEDHKVYKVSEDGTVKTKIDNIENAQAIVLDYSDNLYFYGDDKKPFVYDGKDVKMVSGLPDTLGSVNLIRPPFILDDSVPFLIDEKAYILYANGTSELSYFVVKEKPSAYCMDAALLQYYALDKKIYEYNILLLMVGEILGEFKDFLNDRKDSIQVVSTRSLAGSLSA